MGDGRLRPFTSSYAADFHSPFPGQSKLRSPLRSKEARRPHELQAAYTSVMQRVGEYVQWAPPVASDPTAVALVETTEVVWN